MRTRVRVGVGGCLAALLFAGGAAADEKKQMGDAQQSPRAEEGKQAGAEEGGLHGTRHVAVVAASLQSAATNASMLKQISQSKQTYDGEHGQVFVENIQDALADAEEHLAHLKPMATGKDRDKVQQISTSIAEAKMQVSALQGRLGDPSYVTSPAGRIADEARSAMKPLKEIAKSLQAKVDLSQVG